MVDGDSTNSNEKADKRTCVDDDSASDSDHLEENRLEGVELPGSNVLNPNNVVLTQFVTKQKHSYVHRAGPKPY